MLAIVISIVLFTITIINDFSLVTIVCEWAKDCGEFEWFLFM